MTKFTIYTEDKNLIKIEAILNDNFIIEGYTITNAQGYWQELKEKALKIEILIKPCKNFNYTNILKAICKRIKRVNKQTTVLLTIQKIKAQFI